MERKSLSRRSVLSTGWRALAAAPLLSLPKKSAASVSGNRSLVCLYLLGGSDGNGMFAPLDPVQFDAYAAARGELAMPRHAFLPAEARDSAMQVGFHPALPELRNFFLDGSLALAANIGSERRVSPVSGSVQSMHPDRRYENLAFVAGGYATLKWAASQAGVTSVAYRSRAHLFRRRNHAAAG